MTDENSFARKRARSASPGTTAASRSRAGGATTPSIASTLSADYALAHRLSDPATRNAALNELLQTTSKHDVNYSMSSDVILKELTRIAIVDCLEWSGPTLFYATPLVEEDSKEKANETTPDSAVFRSQTTWNQPPTTEQEQWARYCQERLDPRRFLMPFDQLKLLEAVLVILRNLSFVGANLRLLAYSPYVIALLIGCLYQSVDTDRSGSGGDEGTTSQQSQQQQQQQLQQQQQQGSNPGAGGGGNNNMTLAMCAIHALVNLAPYLDISGQKLLTDKLFYSPTLIKDGPMVPDVDKFGQAIGGQWGFGGTWLAKRLDTKEDTVSDISKEFLLSFTLDHLISVWSLFSALHHILTNCTAPRPVVIMAVDLLQELINHARVAVVGSVDLLDRDDTIPTIRAVLVSMPDDILLRLIDLLYVPRLGPDSLDYIDPVHNIVTRVTTLKLMMGYDATVDTDVRDRVLDVLVPLLELDSPRMAAKLGTLDGVRLVQSLVPVLTTTVGRNEASTLATQLFRELSKATENQIAFQYVKKRMVALASRDPRLAQLVMNHLYVVQEESAPIEDEGENSTMDVDILQ